MYSIEAMQPADWECVRRIYLQGIASGSSTFEADAPGWGAWDAAHMAQPRIVARNGSVVVGWAALSPVSTRAVYAGVAEVSLYVDARNRGLGVGSIILSSLIALSEKHGIWTLQGSIFPENAASLALFGKHGFRQVGIRERLGRMGYGEMAGRWRDVVLVERRSQVAGSDSTPDGGTSA